MIISVEVSYYPLIQEYIQPIADFIERLNLREGLLVRTSSMSTQIIGEYNLVFDTLKSEIEASFQVPNSVFVLKVVNLDLTEIPS